MGKQPTKKLKTRATVKKDNPQRVGVKLRAIRRRLNCSQTEIMKLVTPHTADNLRATISQWERGTKYPTLTTVLKYARLARVPCEVLLDDRLDLPDEFQTLEAPVSRRALRQGTLTDRTDHSLAIA